MKTETEIRGKLAIHRRELKNWCKALETPADKVIAAVKAERISALEWVLGEYEEW